MPDSLKTLIASVTSLVSFPDIAIRVQRAADDPDASVEGIAALLESDPALTVSIIRLANSAAMRSGIPIDTAAKAVTRLGLKQIKQLVLGIETAKSFRGLPNALVSMADFWTHSLYCAIAARHIATAARLANADTAFTAGLLHDIGQLVIFSKMPAEAHRCLETSMEDYDGVLLHPVEQAVMGYDHSDVGAELARQWQLPELLCQCIAGHHEPDKIEAPDPLVWVTHMANTVAVLAELQTLDLSNAPPIDERCWTVLGLSPDILPELVDSCREEVTELLEIFTRG